MPLTHNLYEDHPHHQDLHQVSPTSVRRHDGSEADLVSVKGWHEERKQKHQLEAQQLAQSASSVLREEEDPEKAYVDWISSVRQQEHELSHKIIPANEDNEEFDNDGVQESPSHHQWRYDLEGGRDYDVPKQLDVDLYNYHDAEYIGDIYLGAPESQRATIVIDTGSSWLNVKSCMSKGGCHKHTYDKASNKKEGEPEHLEHYKRVIMKNPKNRFGIAYYANRTKTGMEVDGNHAFNLGYGSADLTGWKYQELTCLRPLPKGIAMEDITQEMLDKRFCVRDIRMMAITESKGMETCDGILGISPKNYARHSYLQELRVAGLIDHGIISFSNAFAHKGFHRTVTEKDRRSYAIFGGINATQIVGGEEGLHSMALVRGKWNPTAFWGVAVRGFAYGKTVLQEPETENPSLGVIDSGTTLAIIPTMVFENLAGAMAERFKDEPEIDMVCVRDKSRASGFIENCYFNNTSCETLFSKHGELFDDFKFQMGDNSVFAIKAPVAFRNGKNTVGTTGLKVDSCGLGFRHHKDDYRNPKRSRYLLGNVLLKNFYSVYDYDQQIVALGVNTHSKDMAYITPYKWHETWSQEKGYKHIDFYTRKVQKRMEDNWMWRTGLEAEEARDRQETWASRAKQKAVKKGPESKGGSKPAASEGGGGDKEDFSSDKKSKGSKMQQQGQHQKQPLHVEESSSPPLKNAEEQQEFDSVFRDYLT